MQILRRQLFVAALFAAVVVLVGPAAGAETISAARYAQPVDRYGHLAPGRPHEYARLTATTNSGRELALEGGELVEIGRCALSAPITGAIKLLSPREVSVGLSSSRPVIAVGNCLK